MTILDCFFFAHFSLNEIVNEYLNFAPYICKLHTPNFPNMTKQHIA